MDTLMDFLRVTVVVLAGVALGSDAHEMARAASALWQRVRVEHPRQKL